MGVPQIGTDFLPPKTSSLSVIVCWQVFELNKYHLGKLNCISFVSEETDIKFVNMLE